MSTTILAASAVSLMVTQGGPAFEAGLPFPDLVLPSLSDGQPTSLADFRGQKVILQIFASW